MRRRRGSLYSIENLTIFSVQNGLFNTCYNLLTTISFTKNYNHFLFQQVTNFLTANYFPELDSYSKYLGGFLITLLGLAQLVTSSSFCQLSSPLMISLSPTSMSSLCSASPTPFLSVLKYVLPVANVFELLGAVWYREFEVF